jgi:hypothetical protein
MRTIAFDSTGPIITVGAANGTCKLARRDAQADRNRGNILEQLIDNLLLEIGWHRRDVEGLGLLTGPGSLTATRLGWATAAGWAQASSIPVIGWTVPNAHRRLLGDEVTDSVCCVHYRADTFLLYDLEHSNGAAKTIQLTPDVYAGSPPRFLTGPGVVGRRESWLAYCGRQTRVASENTAVIGGDTLALWASEDLSRGISSPLTTSPLEYGLPPDFKKLI